MPEPTLTISNCYDTVEFKPSTGGQGIYIRTINRPKRDDGTREERGACITIYGRDVSALIGFLQSQRLEIPCLDREESKECPVVRPGQVWIEKHKTAHPKIVIHKLKEGMITCYDVVLPFVVPVSESELSMSCTFLSENYRLLHDV